MKNSAALVLSLIVLLVAFLSFSIGRKCSTNMIEKTDTICTTRTDTLWKDTTITKTKLIPKYVIRARVDTVYDEKQTPIELVTENKVYNDTIVCDKDTAELRIFTSGIRSSVDSINLSLRKSEIIKTNTIEITKLVERRKTLIDRFHIGIQGGYGYGFKYNGLEPYVGIGVSFDL